MFTLKHLKTLQHVSSSFSSHSDRNMLERF